MERRNRPEWRYKVRAINRAAEILGAAIPEEWYELVTFVPVPPSKTRDHPEYDDRLVQILWKAGEARAMDIRELVVMNESIDPAHLTGEARSVQELVQRMGVEMSLKEPEPKAICIFDDVLTTGAHFKAVQMHLGGCFPQVPTAGLFLARRAAGASPI